MEQPEQPWIAIAIDGPAASGKSSVARGLARRLGYLYVNSGSLYRGVSWCLLERGVPASDSCEVIRLIESMEIVCGVDDGASSLTIDGCDPTPHLSSERVNASVSGYSAIPEVREKLVEKLHAYSSLDNLVMEGRDIGSVVFPDTPYKFYIDASEEVRNARRAQEGYLDQIAERDKLDSSRKTSPLTVPDGAVVIDSSEMTIEEVVDEIVQTLESKGLPIEEGAA
ncbi:MAG: (d)CMP kinase [Verrucomicrobiota bacterium]